MDKAEKAELARQRRRAEQHARWLASRRAKSDEALSRLTGATAELWAKHALMLYEAATIVEHTYSPYYDDHGLVDMLRAVQKWTSAAARSGDGSGPPPDIRRYFRPEPDPRKPWPS